MIKRSAFLAWTGSLGLPLAGQDAGGGTAAGKPKPKVVVAGAHPDDPESGCGGTIALYSDLGHDVVILYLTRGEAGISGTPAEEAARIRTAECHKACAILEAQPVFAGQIDGQTEVNATRYEEFWKLLDSQQPDIVFTHWPVDTHRDHRATSPLVYDAWLRSGKKYPLYYFEVMTGEQSQNFHPSTYVNITQTESRKRAACYAHASQQPGDFYTLHDTMNHFRGMESGYGLAEGFIRHSESPVRGLPL